MESQYTFHTYLIPSKSINVKFTIMKKLVSVFFLLFIAFSVNVSAQLCEPENEYQTYACISRVEMNGMINETSKGVPGETPFAEYFLESASQLVKVTTAETYTLKIDFSNFDSTKGDVYKVKAFFDWNNDSKFSPEESYSLEITCKTKGEIITREFQVAVPKDAVTGKKLAMRIFTHYKADSMVEGPCVTVENGQYEEYYIKVDSRATGIKNTNVNPLSIYPNPTKGVLNVSSDATILGFKLFSLDGKLVNESNAVTQVINIAGNAPGMYVLKIVTDKGTVQSTIVLQ